MITIVFFFFFNDTATTEIYTLSLHDALPILQLARFAHGILNEAHPVGALAEREFARQTHRAAPGRGGDVAGITPIADRKSTRLNSSHSQISYAVFCLKKKKHNAISCHTSIG